jgi:hypothetical protein
MDFAPKYKYTPKDQALPMVQTTNFRPTNSIEEAVDEDNWDIEEVKSPE